MSKFDTVKSPETVSDKRGLYICVSGIALALAMQALSTCLASNNTHLVSGPTQPPVRTHSKNKLDTNNSEFKIAPITKAIWTSPVPFASDEARTNFYAHLIANKINQAAAETNKRQVTTGRNGVQEQIDQIKLALQDQSGVCSMPVSHIPAPDVVNPKPDQTKTKDSKTKQSATKAPPSTKNAPTPTKQAQTAGKVLAAEATANKIVKKQTQEITDLSQKATARQTFRHCIAIEMFTGLDRFVTARIFFDETRMGTVLKNGRRNGLEFQRATMLNYLKWSGTEMADTLRNHSPVVVDGHDYTKEYAKLANDIDWVTNTLKNGKSLSATQNRFVDKTLLENPFLAGLLMAAHTQNRLIDYTGKLVSMNKYFGSDIIDTGTFAKLLHVTGEGTAEQILKAQDKPIDEVFNVYDFNNFPYINRSDGTATALAKIAMVFGRGGQNIADNFSGPTVPPPKGRQDFPIKSL